MAIHLTPTELAREAGLERRDVITKCMELGVPIFQGRIDKTLFLASMREQTARGRGCTAADRQRLTAPPTRVESPSEAFRPEESYGGQTRRRRIEASTGSKTIADLLPLARRAAHGGVREKRDGEWQRHHVRRGRRDRRARSRSG